MSKIISIHSFRGGTGKSNITSWTADAGDILLWMLQGRSSPLPCHDWLKHCLAGPDTVEIARPAAASCLRSDLLNCVGR